MLNKIKEYLKKILIKTDLKKLNQIHEERKHALAEYAYYGLHTHFAEATGWTIYTDVHCNLVAVSMPHFDVIIPSQDIYIKLAPPLSDYETAASLGLLNQYGLEVELLESYVQSPLASVAKVLIIPWSEPLTPLVLTKHFRTLYERI